VPEMQVHKKVLNVSIGRTSALDEKRGIQFATVSKMHSKKHFLSRNWKRVVETAFSQQTFHKIETVVYL
jgi:hypothetical protein